MIRNSILHVFLFLSLSLFATIPTGYYTSLDGKQSAALKTAAHMAIKVHTTLSYSNLWTYFAKTDSMPANPLQVWDMYSSNVTYFSDYSPLNKEHCVPNSWWGGPTVDNEYAYSDLNNLYPADASMNMSKGNIPMSEVGVTTMDNGVSKTGTSIFEGFTGRAFEPANEYKGDFARTYFYMATCYQDYTWLTDATGQYQITNGAYPSLQPWAINLLLKWSRQDPVSAKETTRNDKVYTLQQNRNPFIDYPDLAEYIWGTKTNVSFSISGATNPPNISTSGGVNITSNAVLNFTNSKRTRDFTIAGRFLEGDITVSKSGTNADQFSVSITNIPKANATNGTSLSITYIPTAAGTHNATITLNSTSASPFVIQLIGTN